MAREVDANLDKVFPDAVVNVGKDAGLNVDITELEDLSCLVESTLNVGRLIGTGRPHDGDFVLVV